MSSGYQLILDHHTRQIQGRSSQYTYDQVRPFPLVAYGPPEKLLEWLSKTCAYLMESNRDRAWTMLENINFYNGIQHFEDIGWNLEHVRDQNGRYLSSSDIFVMNHARDFVMQKLAALTRFKPAVNVLPLNSSYKDRIASRFQNRTISTAWYNNEIQDVDYYFCLHALVCGEGYIRTSWSSHFGELSNDQLEMNAMLLAQGQGPEALLQEQELALSEGMERVRLDKQQRSGDVKIEYVYPWLVLKENAMTYRDVNYLFQLNVKHIDQVRLENPGVEIGGGSPDGSRYLTSFNTFVGFPEYCVEVEFFHRSTEFLDGGFYAKFIEGQILEASSLPGGKLPFVRMTDYDDLITPHGRSFFHDLRPPLILHNKLMNLMYRNVAIAGHPKLMIPRGSVNIQQMGSGPFVVEYDPPEAPSMMTFQSISGEIFQLAGEFMRQTQQVSGVHGLSRGDSVPNARAAEILSIYQEQEEQRQGPLTDKRIAAIEKLGRHTLECASQYYKADDERTVRIFGARNIYKIRRLLDVSTLKGPSDVVMERSTSLDNTKQGRINKLVQLSQMPLAGQEAPGLFTKEQLMAMLEIGDQDEFFELYTNAADAARSDIEDIYEGLDLPPPQIYQNHLVYWNYLYLFLQSPEMTSTTEVPPKIVDQLKLRLLMHEQFMYEKAKVSLTYAQELMRNVNYPAIMRIGPDTLPETSLTIAQIVMQHQMPPMVPGTTAPATLEG